LPRFQIEAWQEVGKKGDRKGRRKEKRGREMNYQVLLLAFPGIPFNEQALE